MKKIILILMVAILSFNESTAQYLSKMDTKNTQVSNQKFERKLSRYALNYGGKRNASIEFHSNAGKAFFIFNCALFTTLTTVFLVNFFRVKNS